MVKNEEKTPPLPGDEHGTRATAAAPPRFGPPIAGFTDALAKKGPVPAAGAAAAAVVAQGAALGVLAVRVSATKGSAKRPVIMETIAAELETIVSDAIALIDEDAAAVNAVIVASKSAKAGPEALNGSPDGDVIKLNSAPLELVSLAIGALRALDVALPFIHQNVIAEAGTSAALLHAGARSAALIVRANASGAERADYRQRVMKELREYEEEVERLHADVWRGADGR